MSGSIRFPFVIFATAASALSIAQVDRPILTTQAIVGAKIVQGAGRVIEKGTIVMRDGLILSVGPSVTVPAGAQVLDGTGLTVYPGFIDAGTSKGLKAPDAKPRQDTNPDISQDVVTAMRPTHVGIHADQVAAAMYQPDDEAWKGYRSAGFTSVLAFPESGIFRGFASLINVGGQPRRESVVVQEVALGINLNAPFGGVYPGTELGDYSVARQTLMDAQWYKQWLNSYKSSGGKRPPDDANLQELQGILDGSLPSLFEVDDEARIIHELDFADQFKLRAILLGAGEAYKRLDRIKASNAGVVLSLNFIPEPLPPVTPPPPVDPTKPVPPEPKKEEPKVDETAVKEGDDRVQERERLWVERVSNAGVLEKAGVPFAFTTRGTKSFGDFMGNVRKAVKQGLTADGALSALTLNAAKLFGVDRQLGSIDQGKIANVIVTSGDFLDEKTKVKFLYIDGRKIDPERTITPFTNQPNFGGEGL